jgi:3-deoxy-D-manno-octulosonate 8-phosphate phosphatase (KDO 8-P phosphatase)
VNDIPAFPVVGCALAVRDAHPDVLRSADIVLRRKGGYGAVREVCDLIAANLEAD